MRIAAASPVLALAFALVGCEKPASDSAPAASASVAAAVAPSSAPAPAVVSATTAPAASTAASPPTDTVIAQHILVAYKSAKRAPKGVTRSKAEAKARAAEALAKIQAGTPFEDAVREYSDDAGSADRLGSVGKFHREDMDPAFSAAAFSLRVGQVSDVVETPFGFHVIKRTQ